MANVVKLACRFRMQPTGSDAEDPLVESVLTFHAMKADGAAPPDGVDCADLATAVLSWWNDEHGDYVPAKNWASFESWLEDVTATRVEPTPGPPVVLPDPVGDHGSEPGSVPPPQCAMHIGLRTLLDSRRGRGRLFLPSCFVSTGNILGEVPFAWRISIAKGIAGALADSIRRVQGDEENDGPWVLCVYSRVDGDAHPVIGFFLSDYYCVQRRRRVEARTYHEYGLLGEPAEA